MARRLSRHHVEFRTAAAVGIVVAPGTDHSIAMHHPCATKLRVASGRESIGPTDFGGVGVRVYQRGEGKAASGTLKFRSERLLRASDRAFAVWVGPLDHVVVLRANDGEVVEV